MEINLLWHEPVVLNDGEDDNLIYKCELSKISEKPGMYVFARKFGKSVCPLYIGQATNLRTRIEQQLNYTKLMVGVRNSPLGKRFLLTADLKPKKGQQIKKLLNIIERAYIENALSEGHELLNLVGTKIPNHIILSKGAKKSHKPFPRKMRHKI